MWIYKERGEVFYKEIAITALAVKFSISGVRSMQSAEGNCWPHQQPNAA